MPKTKAKGITVPIAPVTRRGVTHNRVYATRRIWFPMRRLKTPLYRVPYGGFPQTKVVKLKYCDQYNISAGVGAIASYEWRANSLYDPDKTSAGHQPMFRDVYANIYNKYRVLSSKITIKAVPYPDETHASVLYLDDQTGLPAKLSTIREQNMTKSEAIVQAQGKNNSISLIYSAKKVFGRDNDDETLASTGTNPANQQLFAFATQNLNSAGATNCQLVVQIDYWVQYSDMKEQVEN